jgi:CubicO group peptidase (beta-lactamase class C family)
MNCKILKSIPIIGLLIATLGCSTKAPKIPAQVKQGDYSHLKEYMYWFIQKEMDEKNIVGLSIALVDNQKIVWQEGFGYADKEQKIKALPNTKYRAGSISKLFNAMAVMKLVESGKMDIDKPLVTYLPEFNIKSRFGKTDGITPRTIVTHHSGLPSDWLDGMFSKNPMSYTQHVKEIKNEYVAYPPNKIFSYSNLAVTLLGHSVQMVSGEKYAKFLEKILLKPLGMKDSNFDMALEGKNISKAYSQGKETIEYPIGEVPAGALNTTVTDLSRLAMMINNEGKIGNERVLKANTLKEMIRVQNENIALDLGQKIGLGYFIDDALLDGESVYFHDGGTIAHRSSFMVSAKSKLGVVVLCNSDSANSSKIAKELLQKAWEVKTTKKLEDKNENNFAHSDFTGTYASIFGKVDIVKKSDEHYVAQTPNGKFNLKYRQGKYYAKYLLFGFIPIGDAALDDFGLVAKDVNAEHIIVVDKTIFGTRVKPQPISKAWQDRLGKYRVLNQLEPEKWKIKELILKMEDGYLVYETTMKSGVKSSYILRVINDFEAIIEGLGRGTRESVRVENGILMHSGLRFEPVLLGD